MPVYKIEVDNKNGFNRLPSAQTLFGAICWTIVDLFGEKHLEQYLEGEFPYRLTSLFPADMLPLPLQAYNYDIQESNQKINDIQKLKYIPKKAFSQWFLNDDVKDVQNFLIDMMESIDFNDADDTNREKMTGAYFTNQTLRNHLEYKRPKDVGGLYYLQKNYVNYNFDWYIDCDESKLDELKLLIESLNYGRIGKGSARGENQWSFSFAQEETAYFSKIKTKNKKVLLAPLLVTESAYKQFEAKNSFAKSERILFKADNRNRRKMNYKNIKGVYTILLEGSVLETKNNDNKAFIFQTIDENLMKMDDAKNYHYSYGVCI